MHRASRVARNQCEWKHGGDTVDQLDEDGSPRSDLDGGWLLMEGTTVKLRQRFALAGSQTPAAVKCRATLAFSFYYWPNFRSPRDRRLKLLLECFRYSCRRNHLEGVILNAQ